MDRQKVYILLTPKTWHIPLFENLKKRHGEKWFHIGSEENFKIEIISSICPDKIFIPHWSSIIPSTIYEQFECVVFHMTDLPYGRGGSPLQNLIVRGHETTKMSAIKVTSGIDEGPIYMKKELALEGTAKEIFLRSVDIIQDMINQIILNNPIPTPQEGDVVKFKRRTKEECNIQSLKNLGEVFDYIRMLDCEGYPNAFLETNNFKLEFFGAEYDNDNSIITNVRITKK